jgi:O-antigen ligase
MATRPASLPASTPTAVSAGALAAAALVGGLMTVSVPAGMAALIGVCYAPLAMVNLRLGLALWVPLTFLEGLPLFNAGGKAAGLIIALAWLGSARQVWPRLSAFVGRHRATAAGLAGFIVWITLSVAWAASPSTAARDLWHWYVLALIFLVIVTVAGDGRTIRMVLHGLVVGAVLSVVIGGLYGGLSTATVDLQAETSGRLYGAAGDPNFLAAGLVPAMVVAAGLIAGTRSWLVRSWLLLALGVLTVGLTASESRGGIIAMLVTLLVALVFFRRRRAYVLLLLLVTLGLGGAWFATTPSAWQRVTTFNDQGSGRSDIWRVAIRVAEAHPITGAGLANFQVVSKDYVRRPGSLKRLEFVVDRPHVAHNLYLEALSDTGAVGLALLLLFMTGCLRAAWVAGMRFERAGDAELEALSRAVLVAGIAFMTAAVFISAGEDKRLWILLALGPALRGVAARRA